MLKHKIINILEKLINLLTLRINLRVILAPQSALHSQELTYRKDGLFTSHNVNFVSDELFIDVINGIRKEVSHSVYHEYRIYMAIKLVEKAMQVSDSIFVECGVGEGILSLAIHRYIEKQLPTTYLIDTFSGIDEKYLSEVERGGLTGEEKSKEALRSYKDSSFEAVTNRFKEYKNVRIIRGTVPDVLIENKGIFEKLKISYLHIDMNNAFPEYSALKFFYDKMCIPGFILFDDYGFKGLQPQKDAIDKACKELGIPQAISLPTGQGLIIRSA